MNFYYVLAREKGSDGPYQFVFYKEKRMPPIVLNTNQFGISKEKAREAIGKLGEMGYEAIIAEHDTMKSTGINLSQLVFEKDTMPELVKFVNEQAMKQE